MLKKIKLKLKKAWNWTKEKARKAKRWIIALVLGTAALAATQLAQPDYLTYEQYQQRIADYNQKIQEIKKDCANDKRCLMVGKKKYVHFKDVRSKKDVIKKLEKW